MRESVILIPSVKDKPLSSIDTGILSRNLSIEFNSNIYKKKSFTWAQPI